MSTIHLIGGEKGGVGKSVMSRVLAQFFIDEELEFCGVDADMSHGALMRYYSEYSSSVDLESFSSADQIMDRALEKERRVLVDLPAQSARRLRRWMDAGDLISFSKEMNVRLVFWHVSDGGFDSVNQLEAVIDTLGSTVDYLVIRNYGRSNNFFQLDESDALKRVLDAGGKIISLPPLDAETMYKIDTFGSSFWAAVNASEGKHCLSPMERRRTERWLEQCYESIGTSLELI